MSSQKLNQVILNLILIDNIEKEKTTDIEGVCGLLIENYYIFYDMNDLNIAILSVCDTSQNLKNLKYR